MALSLAGGVSTPDFRVPNFSAPGFEGFEKRLEVWFSSESSLYVHCGNKSEINCSRWLDCQAAGKGRTGLRAITRADLDTLVRAAECSIVCHLGNEIFDAYVLSESSLFVFPSRLVMKTCGTTALLKAVPHLLKCAARMGMKASGCKYTRGTFMFPAVQPYPHGSFEQEVEFLERHFGSLGEGGRCFILGDPVSVVGKWHVYYAAADAAVADKEKKMNVPSFIQEEDLSPLDLEQKKKKQRLLENATAVKDKKSSVVPDTTDINAEGIYTRGEPTYTLEMCMTELNSNLAQQFFKGPHFVDAKTVTKSSGIADLIPGSKIDDFMFDPCGYSMNGVDGHGYSTVHITPEEGFSYASFEMMGYDSRTDVGAIIQRALQCLKPGWFSVSLSSDGRPGPGGAGYWGAALPVFEGYYCEVSEREDIMSGGRLAFHTFRCSPSGTGKREVDPIPLFSEMASLMGSPRAVLDFTKPQLSISAEDLWESEEVWCRSCLLSA